MQIVEFFYYSSFPAKSWQNPSRKIQQNVTSSGNRTLDPSTVHFTVSHLSNWAKSALLVIQISDFTSVGAIDLVGFRGTERIELTSVEHEYKDL